MLSSGFIATDENGNYVPGEMSNMPQGQWAIRKRINYSILYYLNHNFLSFYLEVVKLSNIDVNNLN